ncbi:hypothetical protein ACFY5F_37350 [Streptomyces sp. NPDC013161]|uniref:hypothetical protein n=1 Tax=Streptomyces sp. NPDC013161 TaxID=3364862 RepID=UPI00369B40E3
MSDSGLDMAGTVPDRTPSGHLGFALARRALRPRSGDLRFGGPARQLADFHTELADLRAISALHRGTAWEFRPEA